MTIVYSKGVCSIQLVQQIERTSGYRTDFLSLEDMAGIKIVLKYRGSDRLRDWHIMTFNLKHNPAFDGKPIGFIEFMRDGAERWSTCDYRTLCSVVKSYPALSKP